MADDADPFDQLVSTEDLFTGNAFGEYFNDLLGGAITGTGYPSIQQDPNFDAAVRALDQRIPLHYRQLEARSVGEVDAQSLFTNQVLTVNFLREELAALTQNQSLYQRNLRVPLDQFPPGQNRTQALGTSLGRIEQFPGFKAFHDALGTRLQPQADESLLDSLLPLGLDLDFDGGSPEAQERIAETYGVTIGDTALTSDVRVKIILLLSPEVRRMVYYLLSRVDQNLGDSYKIPFTPAQVFHIIFGDEDGDLFPSVPNQDNNLNPNQHPVLVQVLRDMQNPTLMAISLWTFYHIVIQLAGVTENITMFYQLRVYTHREIFENLAAKNYAIAHGTRGIISIRDYAYKDVDLNTGFMKQYFSIDVYTPVEQIYQDVLLGIYGTLSPPRTHHSFTRVESDFVAVHQVNLYFAAQTLPSPLYAPPSYNQVSLQNHIKVLLEGLKGFRIPPQLKYTMHKLSERYPANTSELCLIESLLGLRFMQFNWVNTEKKGDIIKQRSLLKTHFDRLPNDLKHPCTNLLKHLKVFMRLESIPDPVTGKRFWDDCGVTYPLPPVFLGFFHDFGKPPPYPTLRLTFREDIQDIFFSLPPLYDRAKGVDCVHTFRDPEDLVEGEGNRLLLYAYGHILISTFRQFSENIQQKGTQYARVCAIMDTEVPKPHELLPIKDIKMKTQKAIKLRQKCTNPTRLQTYRHVFDDFTNSDYSSADLETGLCTVCQSVTTTDDFMGPKTEVQEAFACSVAWGTTIEDSRTFVGQECFSFYRDNKIAFADAQGCITQMLRYLESEWGQFYHMDATVAPPKHLVHHNITFFNGSRFDLLFLLQTLTYWNLPFTFLPQGNEILQICWGIFTFTDFARLYPNCSLDECSKTFYSEDVSQHPDTYLATLVKPVSKWKVFPYLAITDSVGIDDKVDLRFQPLSVWGGKFINKEHPNAEENLAWWKSYTGVDYYCAREHLGPYCLDDTLILQYCVTLHIFLQAKGERAGRAFNACKSLTASSMAWTIFLQAYLKEGLYSPDLTKIFLPLIDPISGRRIRLTTLLRTALRGGLVTVHRHIVPESTHSKKWAEYTERTGKPHLYGYYDFNSHYPAVAASRLLPTEFLGYDDLRDSSLELWEVMDPEILVDYYLYNAEVQYPKDKSGIMIRYEGHCVSPSYIPSSFQDPAHRGKVTTFTMLYGCELKQALEVGAKVKVGLVLKFKGSDLFAEFMTETYAIRRASTSKLTKLVEKLKMNGLVGKTAQGIQPKSVVVYGAFDVSLLQSQYPIVSIRRLFPTKDNVTPILVQYVEPKKRYPGQWMAINACVTAWGRTTLLNLIHKFTTQCTNQLGELCEIYYNDTDSKIGDLADPEQSAANAQFHRDYMDNTKLGWLKCEDTFDWLGVFAPKIYAGHTYQPGSPITDAHLQVEDIKVSVNLNPDQWHALHKGLSRKCVNSMTDAKISAAELQASFVSKRQCQPAPKFVAPDSFKRDLALGMRKQRIIRSLQPQVLGRKPPNEEGVLHPFETLEQFHELLDRRNAELTFLANQGDMPKTLSSMAQDIPESVSIIADNAPDWVEDLLEALEDAPS